MAAAGSGDRYERNLGRNAANYTPLTPLTFLERTAAVYPHRPSVIHGARRFTNSGVRTCARVGLVNNANDAFAWALLPLLLVRAELSTAAIAAVVAVYPIVWGTLQLATGPLSDRIGRRGPITTGMLLQAGALTTFAVTGGLAPSLVAAAVLGVGTALAYPALIAATADLAPAGRQEPAVGFYRMWRDAGYVAGALAFGAVAEVWGLAAAAVAAGVVTAMAGLDAGRNLPGKYSSEPLISRTIGP
jgi:MFS family permease